MINVITDSSESSFCEKLKLSRLYDFSLRISERESNPVGVIEHFSRLKSTTSIDVLRYSAFARLEAPESRIS